MAFSGEVPWHGLGFAVNNNLSTDEMMKAAKCDWEVTKVPTFARVADDEYLDTGKFALMRSSDNRILDVISNDWNPVQNAEAFEFFKEFVEAGKMEMHTAGSLDNGRNVWVLAKLNEGFEVMQGDKVDGYLLFSNPHRYGRAITVRFTPIRVVCNNTLTFALSQSVDQRMSVSVNHRQVFDAEIVKETLGISKAKLKKYEETAKFLSSKKFDKESLSNYLREVFPSASKKEDMYSRPAQAILDNMESQPGVEFGRGTWWQVFGSVTYTIDHKLGRSADTRLNSAWFGVNSNRKQEAMKKAVEYANAA